MTPAQIAVLDAVVRAGAIEGLWIEVEDLPPRRRHALTLGHLIESGHIEIALIERNGVLTRIVRASARGQEEWSTTRALTPEEWAAVDAAEGAAP